MPLTPEEEPLRTGLALQRSAGSPPEFQPVRGQALASKMPVGTLPTGLGKKSSLLGPEEDAVVGDMYQRARMRAAKAAAERAAAEKAAAEKAAAERAAAEKLAAEIKAAAKAAAEQAAAEKAARRLEREQKKALRKSACLGSDDDLSTGSRLCMAGSDAEGAAGGEEEEEEEEEEDEFAPRDPSPPMGVDEPSWNGVVYTPDAVGLEPADVQVLRSHFEQLKETYHTFQGVTRGMASASRGVGGLFPEMWKPFDSSKTWPMCIFYRNPNLDPLLYEACRSSNCAIYGDNTSPRMDDPAWDQRMETGLVSRVKDYVLEHSQDFGLKHQVAFSIQVLWYDTKTRKAEHKDPKAYTIISALNLQGRADLELYDPKKRRTHQCVHLPEGSLYVMHNDAVRTFDHAVSAPDASFKDSRVTMILRFCDQRDLNRLKGEVERLRSLGPLMRKKRRKHPDPVVLVKSGPGAKMEPVVTADPVITADSVVVTADPEVVTADPMVIADPAVMEEEQQQVVASDDPVVVTADPMVTADPAVTADPVVITDPAVTAEPVVTGDSDPEVTSDDPVVAADPEVTTDPEVTSDDQSVV